ncbi:MAG: adenylate/guanylate cyclase domain-containing protein [Candidatus Eisenbacteria bacterium]
MEERCASVRTRLRSGATGRLILRLRSIPDSLRFSATGVAAAGAALRGGRPASIAPEEFRGRHVFIGADFGDRLATPARAQMSPPEFWASVLDNLITDSFVRVLPFPWFLGGALVLSLVAAAIGLRSINPWFSGGLIALLAFTSAVVSWFAFDASIWIPLIPLLFSVLVSGTWAIGVRHSWEARRRAFVDRAFSQYVPPTVVEAMLINPDLLKLGGESREVTVFFADLEGFTGLAESTDAEKVTAFLNEYLQDVGNIVLEHEGTIDKFIGDAVVAFWNAPLEVPEHPSRAVACVRAVLRRHSSRSPDYERLLGIAAPRVRIGVATGRAVVGNLGSPERFDYSAIGDAVNLASRLEAANKTLGSTALVDASTWMRVPDQRGGRPLGTVLVAGRKNPVAVYEVFSHDPPTPDQNRIFEEARECALQGRFGDAADLLESSPGPVAASFSARYRRLASGEEAGPCEPWPVAKGDG